MDITMARADLVAELALVDKVVARKTTIPVLANVLLRAGVAAVHVVATDLDIALTSECTATVSAIGEQLAPARKLYDLVRSLPDEQVRLYTDGNGVMLKAAGFSGRLQAAAVADFPMPADPPAGAVSALPLAQLQHLISRVSFATTDDDQRYFLAGVRLEADGTNMRMISTDSRRLALASTASAAVLDGVLVPRKAVAALLAVLEGHGEGDVHYSSSLNHMFFAAGGRTLMSKKVDGKFPDYTRIVPKAAATRADIKRPALTDALRRAVMFGDNRHARFVLQSGQLTVAARGAEVGDATEQFEVEYKGGEVDVQLNAGFVLDFLGAVGTELVSMEVPAGNRGPVVFHPVGGDVDYTYVVMPVTV